MSSVRVYVLLFLALCSGGAFAAAPVSMVSLLYPEGYRYFMDTTAAGQASAASQTANSKTNHRFEFVSATSSSFTLRKICIGPIAANGYCPAGSSTTIVTNVTYQTRCAPDGAAPDTSKPLAQQCAAPPPVEEPPPVCTKGDRVTVSYQASEAGGSPVTGSSDGQCEITLVDVLKCVKGTDGKIYCTYVGVKTGNPLKPSTQPPVTPPTAAPGGTEPERVPVPPFTGQPGSGCPKGTVQGGVNSDGVPMCIGTGSAPPVPPPLPPTKTTENTTSNPDGSTTVTKTTVQTNKDGSTSTTTVVTTKAPDGSVSTSGGTVVSQTPAGNAGATDATPEQEQANFCKQNPNLAVCRDSSVSGKCGEISCMGDAVQCATLRAAAAMQCQQDKDIADLAASPQKTLGSQILNGSDPLGGDIGAAIKGSEVDLSKPNLDQSGFLGGGTCIPNKTFNVMGRAVNVEFTEVCNNIQPLRAAVLACAFIVAYLLVSRSVLSS